MAREFERSRWVVAGREVTITSWFDDTSHTWSASAPTYCHLLSADVPADDRSPSRALAIERVVRELASRLRHAAQG